MIKLILLLFPLLTTSLYYLGARAMVTKWLWSRYPPKVDSFMSCAACSGFWYGLLVASSSYLTHDLGSEPVILQGLWILTIGLASIFWTPVLADFHERSLLNLAGGDDRGGDDEPIANIQSVEGDGATSCIECGAPWVTRSLQGPRDDRWGMRCCDCATREV